MRRLFALIKKIAPFSLEQQDHISGKLRKKVLLPGERLEDDIPHGSWLFIEEGFLSILEREKTGLVCKNFYNEGESMIILSIGVCEPDIIEAVEKSVVYYLTPDDRETETTVSAFFRSRLILNMRFYRRRCKRERCLAVENEMDRINYLKKRYTILFRAPEKQLAEYLNIKNELVRTRFSSEYQKAKAVLKQIGKD